MIRKDYFVFLTSLSPCFLSRPVLIAPLLQRFLPLTLVVVLKEEGPDVMLRIFDGESDTPELIWDSAMRSELRVVLAEQLDACMEERKRRGHADEHFSLQPGIRVRYQKLEDELFIGGVYVSRFLKEPTFNLRDPTAFLESLLQRWARELELFTTEKLTSTNSQTREIANAGQDVLQLVTNASVYLCKVRTNLCDKLSQWGYMSRCLSFLDEILAREMLGTPLMSIMRLIHVAVNRRTNVEALVIAGRNDTTNGIVAFTIKAIGSETLHSDAAFIIEMLKKIYKDALGDLKNATDTSMYKFQQANAAEQTQFHAPSQNQTNSLSYAMAPSPAPGEGPVPRNRVEVSDDPLAVVPQPAAQTANRTYMYTHGGFQPSSQINGGNTNLAPQPIYYDPLGVNSRGMRVPAEPSSTFPLNSHVQYQSRQGMPLNQPLPQASEYSVQDANVHNQKFAYQGRASLSPNQAHRQDAHFYTPSSLTAGAQSHLSSDQMPLGSSNPAQAPPRDEGYGKWPAGHGNSRDGQASQLSASGYLHTGQQTSQYSQIYGHALNQDVPSMRREVYKQDAPAAQLYPQQQFQSQSTISSNELPQNQEKYGLPSTAQYAYTQGEFVAGARISRLPETQHSSQANIPTYSPSRDIPFQSCTQGQIENSESPTLHQSLLSGKHNTSVENHLSTEYYEGNQFRPNLGFEVFRETHENKTRYPQPRDPNSQEANNSQSTQQIYHSSTMSSTMNRPLPLIEGEGVDARSKVDPKLQAEEKAASVAGAPGAADGRIALLQSALLCKLPRFLLNDVLENSTLPRVKDPAAVKVHSVELLKMLTEDPGFGMKFRILLDDIPAWNKYKSQDHSLFITGPDQKTDYFLTDGRTGETKKLLTDS